MTNFFGNGIPKVGYSSQNILKAKKEREQKEEDKEILVASAEKKNLKKHWLAGAVAGIVDVWACHGFDRVKTHMQQNPHLKIYPAAKEIWMKGGGGVVGGLKAFYEGILPMTVEACMKVGLRYLSFQWFVQQYKTHVQKENESASFTAMLLGGLFAGTVESVLIVIPCELLKVRHMTQTSHESFVTVFRNVLKDEGIKGLYKGGSSTLLRQASNQMIRFPIFEASKELVKEKTGQNQLPAYVNLALGGLAGSVSTLANTPFDTIKTRQQRQGNNLTALEIVKQIYQERGIRAYWAGVVPRLVRVAPGQAITFAVYEKVMDLIGRD